MPPSFYKKPNMLSYVNPVFDQTQNNDASRILAKKRKKTNGWNVFAVITTIIAVLAMGVLAIATSELSYEDSQDSVIYGLGFISLPIYGLALALAISGLVVAVRRKEKIVFSSILSGIVVLLFSINALIFISTATQAPSIVHINVPQNYQLDSYSGIAVKYHNQASYICDSEGICSFEVTFLATQNVLCPNGGTLSQSFVNDREKTRVTVETQFPNMQPGEKFASVLTWAGLPNEAYFIEDYPRITCL